MRNSMDSSTNRDYLSTASRDSPLISASNSTIPGKWSLARFSRRIRTFSRPVSSLPVTPEQSRVGVQWLVAGGAKVFTPTLATATW